MINEGVFENYLEINNKNISINHIRVLDCLKSLSKKFLI